MAGSSSVVPLTLIAPKRDWSAIIFGQLRPSDSRKEVQHLADKVESLEAELAAIKGHLQHSHKSNEAAMRLMEEFVGQDCPDSQAWKKKFRECLPV